MAAINPLQIGRRTMAALLFSPHSRQACRAWPFSLQALVAKRLFLPGARGINDMRQLRSLLRSAPSRIGRRFAQIVAIAAASLPDAGV
jgi:hypothetical protein